VVTPLGPPSVAVRAPAKVLADALRPASAHLACSRVASTLIGENAAASEPTAKRVSTAAEAELVVQRSWPQETAGAPCEPGGCRPPSGSFPGPAAAATQTAPGPTGCKHKTGQTASSCFVFEDNAVLRDFSLEEKGAQRNRQGRVPEIQTLCAPEKRKQKPQCVVSEKSDETGVERACQLVSAETSNTRDIRQPKSKQRNLVVGCLQKEKRSTYGSLHGHFRALHLAPV